MRIEKFERYYHLHYDKNRVFSGHRHNSFEANIVLSGCLEVTCGNTVFCLSAGDFAMWKPGIFHMNRALSNGVTEFVSLLFRSVDADFISNSNSAAVFRLSESDLAIVKVLDEEIMSSSGKINRVAYNLLEALLLRLNGKATMPELSARGYSAIYHDAVNIMTENIGEALDAKTIAKLCGVCLTSLKKAFTECAGKGVKAYFLEMKTEKAKEMLARGVSSEAVASVLGFSSPAYFSQCFKREVGCTASEFKRQCKEQEA